jgi:hypothetical protein
VHLTVRQISALMFGLFSLCIFQGTAAAQTGGFVSVQISPNPANIAQNVNITSSLTSCIAAHTGQTGSLEYFESTTPSGTGQEIGRDFGTGFVWNVEQGQFGENPANYFITGQFTPASFNGQPDPCATATSFSQQPVWTELVVQ